MPIRRTEMTAVSLRFKPEQDRGLKAYCRRTGLPMTEVVRRAVDAYFDKIEAAEETLARLRRQP